MNDGLWEKLNEMKKNITDINDDSPVLIHKGERLNTNKINSLLSILKRKQNLSILGGTTDIQKINRSKILQDLNSTNGKETIEIIQITGITKSTQFEHALEEFLLSEYSRISSDNS